MKTYNLATGKYEEAERINENTVRFANGSYQRIIDPREVERPKQRRGKSVSFDDIESGLGIGGAGSDDYSIHNTGPSRELPPASGHGFGYHGKRYEEDCENCGRNTIVCNWCGYCENCCTC